MAAAATGVAPTAASAAGAGAAAAAAHIKPLAAAATAAVVAPVAPALTVAAVATFSGGVVTTVAGAAGQFGDADGVGAAARFSYPGSCAMAPDNALDPQLRGKLLVGDDNHKLRAVDLSSKGFSVSTAVPRQLRRISAIAFCPSDGALLLASGTALWRFAVPNGAPHLVAGHEHASGFADGAGAEARVGSIMDIVCTRDGRVVFCVDAWNRRIRRVDLSKGPDQAVVSTVAGNGEDEHIDGPALTSALRDPCSVAFDPHALVPESVLLIGCSGAIRRLDLTTGLLSTVVTFENRPIGVLPVPIGDAPPVVNGMAVTPSGLLLAATEWALWVVDTRATGDNNKRVIAGDAKDSGSADGAALTAARFHRAHGIAVDVERRCAFITDSAAHTIRCVTLDPSLFAAPVIVRAPPPPTNQQLTAANEQLTTQLAAAHAHAVAADTARAAAEARTVELTAQVARLTTALSAAETGPLNAELKTRPPNEWSARAVVQWLKTTPPLSGNDKLNAFRDELLRRAEAGAGNAVDGAALLALDFDALTDSFAAHITDLRTGQELLKAIKPLKEADAKAKAALSQPLQELAAAKQQIRAKDEQIAHNAKVAVRAAARIAELERALWDAHAYARPRVVVNQSQSQAQAQTQAERHAATDLKRADTAAPPHTAAAAVPPVAAAAASKDPELMGLLQAIASGVTGVSAKLDVAADNSAAAAAAAAAANSYP